MNEHEVESLHQQASSFYLQGNLEQAHQVWARLLNADPSDERAQEGVRLCDRMLGSTADGPDAERLPAFAPGADPPGETAPTATPDRGGAGLQETVDELLDFGETDRPAREGAVGAGLGVLDLSDLAEEETEPAPESFSGPFDSAEAAPAGAAMWNFGVGPEEPTPTPAPDPVLGPLEPLEPLDRLDPAPPETASGIPEFNAADDQLRRRVNELMASALLAMEGGKTTEALRLVDRMLILDEENETALSLKAKLEQGGALQPSASAPPTPPSPAHDMAAGLDLEFGESPDSVRAFEIEPPEPEVPLEPEVRPPAELADGQALGEFRDAPEDEVPLESTATRVDEPAGRSRRRVGFKIPAPRVLIPLVALAVLGLGYLVWGLLPSAEPEPIELGAATRRQAPRKTASDGGAETRPQDPQVPLTPEPSPEQRLAAAVAAAESHMADENYGEAVIAFGTAIELSPEDAELRLRLSLASEGYRLQRERAERWERARAWFAEGNYREALAFFYRLPEEEQTHQVQRFKTNGWYNLGIQALRLSACDDAKSHLREALGLAPRDAGVIEAFRLSSSCGVDVSTTHRAKLDGLRSRKIDD